jgi:hypothetical protein
LVAGRTYYEGNETDIKKNFNAIISNYNNANNINSQNLITSQNLLTSTSASKYNSNYCNNYQSLSNYSYMQNIMYGTKCQPMKYKSYYDEACYANLKKIQ